MNRRKNSAQPGKTYMRSGTTALLICNGEAPARSFLTALASAVDLVVAADGGANVARNKNIVPDVIVGDLDSITPSTRRVFTHSRVLHVPRQDNTDLEKALDFLVGEGVRAVFIAGATGRRMDFTLANVSVLWSYTGSIDWTLVGEDWFAHPVNRACTVTVPIGTTVSLIPYGRCTGITLRGLQYPLVDGTLHLGSIAVSNVTTSHRFSVTLTRGKLLMVVLTRLSLPPTTGNRSGGSRKP